MSRPREQTDRPARKQRATMANALIVTGVLCLAPLALCSPASAQALSFASAPLSAFPSDDTATAPDDSAEGATNSNVLPERLRRTTVALNTNEAPGTIIIDTGNTVLYYVLGQGRAIRYGVGVAREGFTWSGVQTITTRREGPDCS